MENCQNCGCKCHCEEYNGVCKRVETDGNGLRQEILCCQHCRHEDD